MLNETAFAAKTSMDIKLFEELFRSYIHENELPEFKNLLVSAYTNYHELLQETNVQPISGVISLRKKKALETLTENEISTIIYENFRNEITKNFVTPLELRKLETIHENDMEKVFKIIVKSNADLDPEISKKYSIFEKVVKDTISNIILPKDNIVKMKEYVSKLDPTYFEIFDRTLCDIKKEFNEAVGKLTNNLALRMFKNGIMFSKEYDKDSFDLEKYKGLSAVFGAKDSLDEILEKFPKTKRDIDEDPELYKDYGINADDLNSDSINDPEDENINKIDMEDKTNK